MPLPGIPDVEPSIEVSTRDKNGQPLKRFVQSYYRELPYGWDVLTENLVDPCKAFSVPDGLIAEHFCCSINSCDTLLVRLDGKVSHDLLQLCCDCDR